MRKHLARIQDLLRHTTKVTSDGIGFESPFQTGSATFDPKAFQVKCGKTGHELTAKELKLLQVFFSHPGVMLSRDRLLNEAWGYNYYGTTRTLDQMIVQLRKKLGDNSAEPKLLLNVHGVGYELLL